MMKETPWREFPRFEGGKRHRYRIRAKYGMDYEFAARNNQEPYFSVTGEIEEMRGGGWRGAIHGEIAKKFGKTIKPYIHWHMTSPQGPLHYIANAQYWWTQGNPDAFKSTIAFGALPGDKMPDPATPWPEVEAWLVARLPALRKAFISDMKHLGVYEQQGQDAAMEGPRRTRGMGVKKTRSADGMSVRFLPVNQAWALMWHAQVLRIFNSKADAEYELAELRRQSSPPQGMGSVGASGIRGMGSVGDGYAPLASLPADLQAAVSQAMTAEGKDASRYVWKHDGAGNVECRER